MSTNLMLVECLQTIKHFAALIAGNLHILLVRPFHNLPTVVRASLMLLKTLVGGEGAFTLVAVEITRCYGLLSRGDNVDRYFWNKNGFKGVQKVIHIG